MEKKFEFIYVGNEPATSVSQYFLSPDAMKAVADQVNALQKPGGLVSVYDNETGTLVLCSVRTTDDGPYITGWSLSGPMSREEGMTQAREAAGHAEDGSHEAARH